MDNANKPLYKRLSFDVLKIWIEIIMLSLILCTVTAASTAAPACYLWVAAQLIFGLAGTTLTYLFPGLRALQTILGSVIAAAGTTALHFLLAAPLPLSIFMAIVAIGVTVRARILTEKEWDEASPAFLYTIFVVFTLLFTLAIGIIPVLKPFRPIATVLGPVIVVVGLLTMNTLNVRSLTDVQRNTTSAGMMAVSKGLNLQNKLLVLVVLGVVLLLSLLTPLYNAIRRVLQLFVNWLTSLEVTEDTSSASGGGGGGEPDMLGLVGEIPERNPLLVQLEQIFITVVTIAAVIAGVCFVLFMLYKGVRKLLTLIRSMDWYREQQESLIDEYEDTHESLVDLRDLPRQYLSRMGDWLSERLKREPSWGDLKTSAEKARALYRRVLIKAQAGGYIQNRASTPSQTLQAVRPHVKVGEQSLDALRECYEQARYAEREPDSETVEKLNREI